MIWDVADSGAKALKRVALGIQARCLRLTRYREQLVIGSFEGKLAFWDVSSLSSCALTGEDARRESKRRRDEK